MEKAAKWGNEAMQWFAEEIQAGRANEILVKAANGFAGVVGGNLEVLLKSGLSEELWETFRRTLNSPGE
jgi:hypothetical protein